MGNAGLLSPYRVLDLTNERGFLCGKILGDLGADVIKIERPGGDAARNIAPFYHEKPDPEKSLYWFAFNTSKRGITLNIETAEGQAIFKRLVRSADVLLESFTPGYMDRIGLGYEVLSRSNPRLVMTSISGFGQEGPYKHFKDPDIVVWALGGILFVTGDTDRPPLAPSFPQARLFGAMQGALGTVIALFQRHSIKKGQQVDASALMGVSVLPQPDVQGIWDMEKVITHRTGGIHQRPGTRIRTPIIWPCGDGEVAYMIRVGSGMTLSNQLLSAWVDSEGVGNDFLRQFPWDTIGWDEITQEMADQLVAVFGTFFLKHTKAELFSGASQRGIALCPVLTAGELLRLEHLSARGYWIEMEHPELGMSITYPGAFVRSEETTCSISRRAPLVGEHNHEIYVEEQGFSDQDLIALKGNGVI